MRRTILVQETPGWYFVPFESKRRNFPFYTDVFTRMPNISSICGCCR